MRKLVIYWNPSEINLQETEQHKLTTLSKQYYELVVQNTTPITFTAHNDYVKIISASGFL